jgi:hypothetical protein
MTSSEGKFVALLKKMQLITKISSFLIG